MNKRSVKSRPAKASRNQVVRKAVSRRVSGHTEPAKTINAKAIKAKAISKPINIPTVPVAQQISMPGPRLRMHRFRVGQTVLYTSSPISRPGASGTYEVVKLLPSDGDDYQYRIKNAGEAFERVAKESQLELEH
jgi:hypothetical protein